MDSLTLRSHTFILAIEHVSLSHSLSQASLLAKIQTSLDGSFKRTAYISEVFLLVFEGRNLLLLLSETGQRADACEYLEHFSSQWYLISK